MSAEKALDLKQRAVLNAKLLIGPGAVALEKWGAHIGAETWARGEAFARGTGSEGFQEALGAMVKTEGDLQTYFGFNTGEQLLMRGGQAILLGFAVYAENRQLPVNWHLEKMPKPVKYVLETAKALYFASLVAAPVILEKMVKGELVEPVSAGLVLGTAGAGLLYSGLRVAAAKNFTAREQSKQNLHSGKVDLVVKDKSFNEGTADIMHYLNGVEADSSKFINGLVRCADGVGQEIREIQFEQFIAAGPEIVPNDLFPPKRRKSLRLKMARYAEKEWREIDRRMKGN